MIWKFIKDEGNRNLLAWIAAATIGIFGTVVSAWDFITAPNSITFEQIRGGAAKDGNRTFSSVNSSICGKEYVVSGIKVDFSKCSEASTFLEADTQGVHTLDITVKNNSKNPILLKNASLDIEKSEQQFHPPAGDEAKAVPVLTTISLENITPTNAKIKASSCNKSEKEIYKILSGQEVLVSNQKNSEGNVEEICYFQLPFLNGVFNVDSTRLEKCKSLYGDECQIVIYEYAINKPFSLVGEFADPISLPSNGDFRFSIKIINYDALPNNIIARISLNNGEYLSEKIFFFRIDSGVIWQPTPQ